MQALHDASREIDDQIDRIRAEPDGGIFSQIVSQGNLTRHELATTAALLAGAGFETTVNLIGNAIVLGAQSPLGAKILPVEHTIRRWRVRTDQHAP
jgi:cytochrome P450